jgi:O-methyltransferase
MMTAVELYLDLMKRNLTRYGFEDRYRLLGEPELSSCPASVRELITESDLCLAKKVAFDPELRMVGRDWPAEAETMIGVRRLDNLQQCVATALGDGVPGDLMETGVWRGGASIFMRALLAAHGDSSRVVWVADSFQGLPQPDPDQFPEDGADTPWGQLWRAPELAVSIDIVKANFERYGLLDEQVRFLPGWFRNTLPSAPVERLAVLRLDGDLYESTIIALRYLYPKVSSGGYILIDDFGAIEACRKAVADYREEFEISEPIHQVDWTGVYWRVGEQNPNLNR